MLCSSLSMLGFDLMEPVMVKPNISNHASLQFVSIFLFKIIIRDRRWARISAKGVSGAGVGSGDEAENRGEVGVEGLIGCLPESWSEDGSAADGWLVTGACGAGESEYIVASESTSSEILSSSETGISDDGVGSFTRFALWLAKFDPDTVNLPVAHIQDESAVIDSLSSSFTALIMNIDYPSKYCNNGDEGPIRAHHIRNISKLERSYEASMEIGSLVEYLLKSPSFRPIQAQLFDESRVHLFFDGLEWPPPHQRKHLKDCESGFFVEELEVDFVRRTYASVFEVVFKSGFCCFIEK
ncbi:uncharacterized protein G2W53_037325 [Senna tora]|uniref:Uncharacterized protein n=1 Tax=Senna tora TaxID=362788 RepID=A0A834SVT1_9FABA|nr:uncharacterized protein G2W53_037325 [Senna tora]